ncbi:MAG: CPBP family intramembrane glutamic endopeptidase [Candidatus Hodarchaeota archaeon]
MGKPVYKKKTTILKERFRFLVLDVIWYFMIIFALLFLSLASLELFADKTSVSYGIILYIERAILIFIAVPIAFFISKFISPPHKREIIIAEDITPFKGFLKLYKVTKKNYKYQFLYGILIYFFVFLPLDFFTYLLIPDMVSYQAYSLSSNASNAYLFRDYFTFLVAVIIIQFCVSFSEETIFRGFITKSGSERINRISAVIIASLAWGLNHFAYYFDPISESYPFWYPFIWFIQASIIGIILSLLVLRRKWIFPVILAHALNNIISAHALWNFLDGNDFGVIALFLYYPLLIIGIELFIWQYPRIKESLSIGFKLLKDYFKSDKEYLESVGDKLFIIFIDLLIGIMIFLVGFLILI